MPVDVPQDLYGLPLERFIPERAALVKVFRAENKRDAATEVAGMRKPSVAAWAVNQLVRTQSKAVEALFRAGDDLAQAQSGAAAGRRMADAIRGPTRRQRDALDDLLQAAKGLLSSEGHALTPTTLERVIDTLRAASIDEASRRQVRDGCLTQELRFAGLGIGDPVVSPPDRPARINTTRKARRKRGELEKEPQQDRRAAQKRKAEARAEAERRQKATLKAARQAEAEARRAATRAERELAAAKARREEAATSLHEAEHLLRAKTQGAEEAAAQLTKAERALSDLAET
ncbi:MAG: hypothetical protein ACXWNR_07305 [Candidatus Limnocylindrales bacterium]